MKGTRITGIAALLIALGGGFIGCQSAAQEEGGRQTLRERIRERRAEREQAAQATPATQAAQAGGSATERITRPGDYSYTIEHDGIERSYRVHVPPQYKPERPTPLLVSLHGGGANMDYQANDDNYGQISKSDQEGFIVVFPNGYSRLPGGKLATWNAGNCCGPARDKNIDDVGFIRQMINNLQQQLNIDRGRIFATGMSNGGLMAQRLACEMSDTFAAIAPVAGTDNTRSCSPKNPVSVLQIHAQNDDHLPFKGGMGAKSMGRAVTEFTSVPESISRWVRRDSCNASPKRVLEKPGAYCDAYTQCQGGAEVELCVTDSGGHSWPGARHTRGEPASTAISANDVMWDFFMKHARAK